MSGDSYQNVENIECQKFSIANDSSKFNIEMFGYHIFQILGDAHSQARDLWCAVGVAGARVTQLN